jgi:hypothetical protein
MRQAGQGRSGARLDLRFSEAPRCSETFAFACINVERAGYTKRGVGAGAMRSRRRTFTSGDSASLPKRQPRPGPLSIHERYALRIGRPSDENRITWLGAQFWLVPHAESAGRVRMWRPGGDLGSTH